MQENNWIFKVVTQIYGIPFSHADSALPDFRRNMDAYPNHKQYPSVFL